MNIFFILLGALVLFSPLAFVVGVKGGWKMALKVWAFFLAGAAVVSAGVWLIMYGLTRA